MTDLTTAGTVPAAAPRKGSLLEQDERPRRRNGAEARFRALGLIAVTIGVYAMICRSDSIPHVRVEVDWTKVRWIAPSFVASFTVLLVPSTPKLNWPDR